MRRRQQIPRLGKPVTLEINSLLTPKSRPLAEAPPSPIQMPPWLYLRLALAQVKIKYFLIIFFNIFHILSSSIIIM
jgi:hypothetical protein